MIVRGTAQAGAVAERLRALAENAGSDERSAHVLALGELGASTAQYLQDSSPAVRMCAALAPGLAHSAEATAVLLSALGHVVAMDDWFVERPPQFTARPRFAVIAQLVRRVETFDELVDAALPVVPLATFWTVGFDIAPLLAKAFPAADGAVTGEAQKRFLRAMLDNAELWPPTSGNCMLCFQNAGLPFDKEACRTLCGS